MGDGHGTQPVVLLGDLNEWLPLGRPIRWLHACIGRPPAVRSFPALAPFLALDRIWVRPRAALLSVSAHRSTAARLASDHLPVTAELALAAVSGSRAAQHCSVRAESGP
ncbi:MAG: endonuclease/exonuclease/phosphatase family protein [Nevskiaceae bacterium]